MPSASARPRPPPACPLPLANLAGLLALFVLGWAMFGPVAGWSAAMLLAVEGYLIGFARIVQYQSVVVLMTVLTVLILYRLYRAGRLESRLPDPGRALHHGGIAGPLRGGRRGHSRCVSAFGARCARGPIGGH